MNDDFVKRRTFLARTLGVGIAGIALGEIGCAADKEARPETQEREEGFVPLFDGKTLIGWHTNAEKIVHGTGGKWQVEDGAITGEQNPPGNGGMLMTDQAYGDFELRLELKPDWGIDSGVFLRTNEQGVCFQVYCDYHDHGNVGWISTETTSGDKRMIIRPFNFFGKLNDRGELQSLTTKPDERPVAWKENYLLSSASAEAWLAAWKIGQWNALRVRCVGEYPRITTWINGTQLADFDGATCPQPDYDKEDIRRKLGRQGPIALQVHGGEKMWTSGAKCRWRNIRVKKL
jgi:hypothetical protein